MKVCDYSLEEKNSVYNLKVNAKNIQVSNVDFTYIKRHGIK